MTLVFVALMVAIAIEAHARASAPTPRAIRRALLAFTAAFLLQRLGILAFAGRGAGEPPSTWIALTGLVAWAGLARLLACDSRRRDRVFRLVVGALALIAAPFSIEVSSLLAMTGLVSFRWHRHFDTRQRFWIGLGLLALFAIGLRIPVPEESAIPGAASALAEPGRWSGIVAGTYALFGAIALFRAFIRDPSLGIRTVGRRLALSHILVVLVPLLLIGGLWSFTTVLGVNADRAMVATRSLSEEGRRLAATAREALAGGPGAPERAASSLRARGAAWSEARGWLLDRDGWRRFAGDSLAGESRLRGWLDSLKALPRAGVVSLDRRLWYGAAVGDSSDSTRGAVVLVRCDSLAASTPQRVSGARLRIVDRTLSDGSGAVVIGAGRAPAGGGTGPLSPEDSIRLERALRVSRMLGMPDSSLRAERRPGGVRLTTAGDTFDVRRASGPGGNVLLDGHAVVPGLMWNGSRWRTSRALLSSTVDPATALAGLYQNLRENPITLLPVILILGVTLLVLLVAAFDFAMVTGMARSITAVIDALRGGARQLEAGRLDHRIEVRGEDDLWSVAGAFNQAMAGFERSRELERERARLENELELARRIQERLLPAGPPAIAGFEICGLYEPARQVGGDYYDHLPAGEGRVLLVIADVSGKGVPASLLMSGFRASLMSQDLAAGDPVLLARHLNDFLVRSVETGKFVTAFLAYADSRAGVLDYVNAGHNPPLLWRADGSHTLLESGGLMFGVLPGAPYQAGRIAFAPGDLLVLYTDGVTEGANAARELWGDERLLAAVGRGATRPCADLARSLARDVRTFEGEQGPADDVTLLLARRV